MNFVRKTGKKHAIFFLYVLLFLLGHCFLVASFFNAVAAARNLMNRSISQGKSSSSQWLKILFKKSHFYNFARENFLRLWEKNEGKLLQEIFWQFRLEMRLFGDIFKQCVFHATNLSRRTIRCLRHIHKF